MCVRIELYVCPHRAVRTCCVYLASAYSCANSRYVYSVLRLLYMCRQVRVVGGAYGCANSFNPQTGMFKYTSYRDPNVMSTLKTYDDTPAFLSHTATEMSQATLSNAIIGMIGDLDSPMQPDAKGFASMERHLSGMTDELRQERRDQVNPKCTCFTRAASTTAQTLTLTRLAGARHHCQGLQGVWRAPAGCEQQGHRRHCRVFGRSAGC